MMIHLMYSFFLLNTFFELKHHFPQFVENKCKFLLYWLYRQNDPNITLSMTCRIYSPSILRIFSMPICIYTHTENFRC